MEETGIDQCAPTKSMEMGQKAALDLHLPDARSQHVLIKHESLLQKASAFTNQLSRVSWYLSYSPLGQYHQWVPKTAKAVVFHRSGKSQLTNRVPVQGSAT